MAKAHKRISKMLTRKASNAPSESNSESFDDGEYMQELFYVRCVHVHLLHVHGCQGTNRCGSAPHRF